MRHPQSALATARSIILTTAFLLLATTAIAGSLPPLTPQAVPAEPDFSKASSWLALPADPDRFAIDIFWVYPTVLHNDTDWLMDITSAPQLAAAKGTIRKQASVFAGQANLYAPLYRQMNMAALTKSEKTTDYLGAFGRDDVRKALDYYLEHYNNGRPFILAGHSQGSKVLVEILKERWGKWGIEDKLVAGYFLGWSLTGQDQKDNPALLMCESASQTGCFVMYNTVAAGKQSLAPTIQPGAIVVNPITWTTDDTYAPADGNTGSTFFDDDGTNHTIVHFAGAQVQDSGLVVDPKDASLLGPGSATFPKGVYHVFDYTLFYENLRSNVAQRIQTYLVTPR